MNPLLPKTAFEPPAKWRPHFRDLLRLSDALRAESTERSAALRTPVEKGGTDRGDAAAAAADFDLLLAEMTAEETSLVEIEAALDRIRAGTYGICEATRLPIADKRLRALPWTRLSAEAARTLEALKAGRTPHS